MKKKIVSLESITEEELNEAKKEAQFASTSRQNYHCMLRGWTARYVQSKLQCSNEPEGNQCLEIIEKIFDKMDTEERISSRTKQIYKRICDYIILTVDCNHDGKTLDTAKKYLE